MITLTQRKHVNAAAKILFEAYFSPLSNAKKHLNKKIKTKESFVALDGKTVAGVLIYARDYSHYANYAEDLAVSKKHRGKGFAGALLKKFIEVSRKETPKKQRFALSSTDASNKASINLHKKAGFKEIGRLKKLHYGKDEVFFAYKLR